MIWGSPLLWDILRQRRVVSPTCAVSKALVWIFSQHRLEYVHHVEHVAIQDSHHGIECIGQHHAQYNVIKHPLQSDQENGKTQERLSHFMNAQVCTAIWSYIQTFPSHWSDASCSWKHVNKAVLVWTSACKMERNAFLRLATWKWKSWYIDTFFSLKSKDHQVLPSAAALFQSQERMLSDCIDHWLDLSWVSIVPWHGKIRRDKVLSRLSRL